MSEYRYSASWYTHDAERIDVTRWLVIRSTEHIDWLQRDGLAYLRAQDVDADRVDDVRFTPALSPGKTKLVRRPTTTVQPTVGTALEALRRRTRKSYRIRAAELDIARRRLLAFGEEAPVHRSFAQGGDQ